MKRRTLVTIAGVTALTIPGCLGSGSSGGEDEGYPTVSVRSDKVQKKDISVKAEVSRQFSESNPAKIKISFTNDSDSEMQFTFGASPPFSQYISQDSSSPRLIIIPETDNSHIVADGGGTKGTKNTGGSNQLPPETTVHNCWEFPGNLTVYTGLKKKKIAAGETISEEYAVLNYPGNRDCLPANDYHFVSQNYFGQNESWGLTIQLQD